VGAVGARGGGGGPSQPAKYCSSNLAGPCCAGGIAYMGVCSATSLLPLMCTMLGEQWPIQTAAQQQRRVSAHVARLEEPLVQQYLPHGRLLHLRAGDGPVVEL
jgi:hypothetical protein